MTNQQSVWHHGLSSEVLVGQVIGDVSWLGGSDPLLWYSHAISREQHRVSAIGLPRSIALDVERTVQG